LTIDLKGHGLLKEHSLLDIVSIKGGQAYNSVCDNVKIIIKKNDYSNSLNLEQYQVEEDSQYLIITFIGQGAHGMQPQLGINAIDLAFTFLKSHFEALQLNLQQYVNLYMNHFYQDYYGKKLGIYSNHEFMGETSLNIGIISIDHESFYLGINPRYVYGNTQEAIISQITKVIAPYKVELVIKSSNKMIYFDENNPYLKILTNAYSTYRNDSIKGIATGGGTYAKALDNGVAFGPFFSEDNPMYHTSNEQLDLNSITLAIAIYAQALKDLAF
ncbi:MAG: hypothetical protein ACRCTA_06595, partial [Bacilli bacterium]